MAEDERFVPQFAKGRVGNHSASLASGSLGRAFVAFAAVLVLAGGATYGLDKVALDGTPVADVAAEPSPSPEPSHSPEVQLGPDEIFLSWGPSLADWQFAQDAAAAMTVDQAAGQVIVASFSGKNSADLAALIGQYNLGGVIFMGGNIGTQSQTMDLTAAAQSAGQAGAREWPVIVSVDQEGGTVARLGPLVPDMPSFLSAGAVRYKPTVQTVYAGFGRDIAALGFNVNYAPVADVTIGLADPVIRTRSAGGDPENVAKTVVAAMDGFLDAGLVPSIKHFPGHGSVTTDSHVALPVQQATVAQLTDRDFIPFQMAIDSGAPVIMMSHVRVTAWGTGPSTLTPAAYSQLRDEMGFEGVVITDALNMQAVVGTNGPAQAAVNALNAGADLLLMPADTGAAHRGIVDAVGSGALSRERLNEAAARSIALMRWQAGIDPAVETEGDYVRTLAHAATTVVAPLCGRSLVGSKVSISGGWSSERNALADALAAYGVTQGSGGTTIRILGSPDGNATADIVVAMDGPWGLSDSNATAYVGLYGRGDSSLAGLADVLVGQSTAAGQWPVPISHMPYDACPSPR